MTAAHRTPRSVHWRVSVAFILMGVLAFAGMTVQALQAQQLVEHRIWRQLLEAASSNYHEQLLRTPDAPLPRAGVLRAWHLTGGESDIAPYLKALPLGYHTSEGQFGQPDAPDNYHALVTAMPDGKLVTVIDITELEQQQNRDSRLSLLYGCLFFALIGGVIAWLHTNLVKPIRELALLMEAVDPQIKGERLPTHYRQAEIQRIAQASNSHLARVEQFIEREKSLLDQASHEFRTPIAVISGAVDVLGTQALPENARPALARIKQSTDDLHEVMVALLYLSREAPAPTSAQEATAVHVLLPKLLGDHEHLVRHKQVALRLGDIEPTYVNAPEAMLRIAVGNLIRNAAESTFEGFVEVSLCAGVIAVNDSGAGLDMNRIARQYRDSLRAPNPSAGRGLGLFLVGRICERFGWQFSIHTAPSGGTRAELDLTANLTGASARHSG